jgi:pre-mRNA-splicing factor SPF27
VSAERESVPDDPAWLPAQREPSFSPLIIQELERIAAKQPLNAIDLSRYEAQEPSSLPSGTKNAADRTKLREALARAYTSYSYLTSQQQNLKLLDQWGKNAWLMGNWQLENELKELEKELGETKRQIDVLNIGRKEQQDAVNDELKGMEETWKKGVGRTLETEIATESLRREVLEALRDRGQDSQGNEQA